MRVLLPALLVLASCTLVQPEWLQGSVETTLRSCDELGPIDTTPSDVAIWYDDGFGLTFNDKVAESAEACWAYDAATNTADLMLSVTFTESIGTDTTLYIDATPVMQEHASENPNTGLTFGRGDDIFQSIDLDWNAYLR